MQKPQKAKQAAVPSVALIDALMPVVFVVTTELNRLGADNDLSLTQLRVMGILRDRRPRMTELADRLGLKKSTMTGLIGRAEQRGLLARAPNADDDRASDVFLTTEGFALVERLHLEIRQALAPLTEGLDAAEQATLQTLLTRMFDPK